jgi:hypothetical protein
MANKGNRGVVHLSSTLDQSERHRLRQFVESAYLTGLPPGHESVSLLRLILDKLDAGDTQVLVEDEALWDEIFPNAKFSKNSFNRWMHMALQLVKKFVVCEMEEKERHKMRQELLLLKYFNQKGDEKRFWACRENMEEMQADRKQWESDQFYWNYLLELEETMHLSVFNNKKGDLNLRKTIRALDEYYLTERSYLVFALLSQGQLTRLELTDFDTKVFFSSKDPQYQWFFEKPLNKLIAAAIQFMRDGTDNASIIDFLGLLYSSEPEMPYAYFTNLEQFAVNFLVKELDSGNKELLPELHDIYLRRLESGRAYVNGGLRHSELQAMVTVALMLGHLEWVEILLRKHKGKIVGTRYPEDAYRYNLANYYFHVGNFREAYDTLFPYKFEEAHYKIASKILEIKILYEMGELDWLESSLNAVKTYLSRGEKMSEIKREVYVNFVNMMARIKNLDTPGGAARAEALLREIHKKKRLAHKQWLTEKVRARMKKPK